MVETSRRQLFRTGGLAAAAMAMPSPFPALAREDSASAYDLPERDDISHLVSRLTFGLTETELSLARTLGYEGYLDYHLDPDAIDDGPVEEILLDRLPSLSWTLAEMADLARDDPEVRAQIRREFQVATLYRAIYSPRQLFEVMVEFWGNHFAVNALDGPLTVLKPWEDRSVMRMHAMGEFRDLLKADAHSPAMLYSLDNVSNTKDGPNENYARELMELHTLGVDGGYDQGDVQEAARIFTGWAIDRTTADYRFFPNRHDYGAKWVLGIRYPAGRGSGEGDELLDRLAGHPSTAAFLATKLVRRFVADDPPPSLVEKVAATFGSTGGDIRQTLRTLFLSPEFLSAKDAKLKRPFDYVVSVLRSAEPVITERGYRGIFEGLQRLGQIPYAWPTPDGYPDTAPYWTGTSVLLTRWNLALGLADGTFDRDLRLRLPDVQSWATTPTATVDTLVERILARQIAETDRQTLINHAAGSGPVDGEIPIDQRETVARGVFGLLLVSRYFQTR